MKNRNAFSPSEDLRMLKWVARNESQNPIGVVIWRSYKEYYDSSHTEQSLSGRIRRSIIQNLESYTTHLNPFELSAIHRIFGSRLDEETRKRIRRQTLIFQEQEKQAATREEVSRNASGKSSNRKQEILRPAICPGNNENLIERPKRPENFPSSENRSFLRDVVSETVRNQDISAISEDLFVESSDPPQPPAQISLQHSPIEIYNESLCTRTCSTQMKSLIDQSANSILDFMKNHVESSDWNAQRVHNETKNNLKELLEKISKEEEKRDKKDFLMISIESFSITKQLRMKYFSKIHDDSKSKSVHVQSAIYLFFQYFEFYIIKISGENCGFYIQLMNHLVSTVEKLSVAL